MRIHRLDGGTVVHAPAKLNLFFEVLAKRHDGFHEIETLICPIDLYDTLTFRENASGRLEFRCQRTLQPACGGGTALDGLPTSGDNLAVRAVERLRQCFGVDQGATLRLVKRIPIAAGLGGGSSDAAAALVAANEGWRLGLSTEQLVSIAAELGSDVPFFLAGGPATCRGRGELIEPTGPVAPLHFVVVRPPVGLSTAAVYGACRPAETARDSTSIQRALFQGDPAGVARALFNRLEPVAEHLEPWIGRLRSEFAREDFLGHGMSGSGTSYYGVCRHAKHARQIARRLEAKGTGNVFALRSCR